MNIWIFIWVVLAVFVIGIFVWSMEVLYKQKKGWKKLASSLGFSYGSPAILKSPVVEGTYKGYSVIMYSEEQPTTDTSRRQFRTILLMGFQEGFPTGAALASAGRRSFIESLKIEEVHKPDFEGWNAGVVFHTEDDKILSKFMNEERYQALNRLMNLKGKETIFIIDDKEGYYRVETADPLVDPVVVTAMLDKFAKQCDVLRPTKADAKLKPVKKKTKK